MNRFPIPVSTVWFPFQVGKDNCGRLIFKKVTEVVVSGNEYLSCEYASKHRWENEKPVSLYNSGLINNISDPFFASRVGLLGQTAFSKVFGGGRRS